MDYQRIILLGKTTDKIELKQGKKGTPYAEFGVTVAQGKDEAILFPVILFGGSAEEADAVLSKGDRILVEGSLAIEWETGKFKVLSSTFRRL
ncbi:MAG: single-stranded DNA-binding protein [Deltaproteobacteria bacterium]|nr:single-stranded DNA-binding protein [Deltaproteobacteria bacterium]